MKNPLFIILTAAFTARLVSVFFFPMVYHPDELYQYLEQGFRLVEGYGVVPWEYHAGIRSLILPGILASFKWVVGLFSENPVHYFYFSFLICSIISMSAVYIFYKAVSEKADRNYALLMTIIPALFPIFIVFAPRVLTEVIAGHILLICIFLMQNYDQDKSRKFIFSVGLLLGLVFILRFHLVFGIALPVLYLLKENFSKRFIFLILGGLTMVLFSGLVDWITWGSPFHSTIQNINMNVGMDIASRFGETSISDMADFFPGKWIGIAVFVAFISYVFKAGWRGNELYALMVLGVVIPHLFIGHKELRFFYPALTPFLIVAIIGAFRLQNKSSGQEAVNGPNPKVFGPMLLAVTGLSYLFYYNGGWLTTGRQHFEIAKEIRQMPDLKAVAVDDRLWVETISYSLIGKNIPIYVDNLEGYPQNKKVPFDVKILPYDDVKEVILPADKVRCAVGNIHNKPWDQYCITMIPIENISQHIKINTLNVVLQNEWERVLKRLLQTNPD